MMHSRATPGDSLECVCVWSALRNLWLSFKSCGTLPTGSHTQQTTLDRTQWFLQSVANFRKKQNSIELLESRTWRRCGRTERVWASNTTLSSNHIQESVRELHLGVLKRDCIFGFYQLQFHHQRQPAVTKMVSVVTESRERSTHLVIRLVEKAFSFFFFLSLMWSGLWNALFSCILLCKIISCEGINTFRVKGKFLSPLHLLQASEQNCTTANINPSPHLVQSFSWCLNYRVSLKNGWFFYKINHIWRHSCLQLTGLQTNILVVIFYRDCVHGCLCTSERALSHFVIKDQAMFFWVKI